MGAGIFRLLQILSFNQSIIVAVTLLVAETLLSSQRQKARMLIFSQAKK
jgi:hypothetical protein